MSEHNTRIPNLQIAFDIEDLTKGEVTARELYEFYRANRVANQRPPYVAA
jgi:hypothetical protein